MKKTIYLAGVMRGSRRDDLFECQRYREEIKKVLRRYFGEDVEIFDPCAECDESDSNGLETKEQLSIFMQQNVKAEECDLLVAWLPEASMGSAIEIWLAWNAKKEVWIISPMQENWVVKLLSSRLFKSLDEFCSII